ncbi:hypothetical protein M758_6G160700 [Ceratodon purpureus]|nr:hypothetical protein M758_6G160700 [Ceratodon purpureus]
MLFYEIVTGSISFEVIQKWPSIRSSLTVDQGRRLPCGLGHAVKDIMLRCWHPDPTLRPSFHDIAAQLNDTGYWYSFILIPSCVLILV